MEADTALLFKQLGAEEADIKQITKQNHVKLQTVKCLKERSRVLKEGMTGTK